MLPGGRQYVEIHTEEYGIYDRYEQDAFSGIYPRRIGAVSSVRSEDVKDDDGNPFTVYYFRDDSRISIRTITSCPTRPNVYRSRTVTFPDWGRVRTTISR